MTEGRGIGCKSMSTCRDCGCGKENSAGFFAWCWVLRVFRGLMATMYMHRLKEYQSFPSCEYRCFVCAELKLSMAKHPKPLNGYIHISIYYVQYIVSPRQAALNVNLKPLNKQGYMILHWSGPLVREKKCKLNLTEGTKDKEPTSRS